VRIAGVGATSSTSAATSSTSAAASANRLVRLAPETLAGLTPDEIAAIVNFAVPADGQSTLAPLPPLTGTVTGHVFEGDGATPTPFTQVAFKSDSLFFGRTYHAGTDAAGRFTFEPVLDEGASRPVPIDGFSLATTHPTTHVASPAVHGAFGPDVVLAQRDIVFNNTATVSGVVLRHTGAAVTGGSVRLSLAGGSLTATVPIGADARYHATGLPAGTYALSASIPHPQGSALTGIGSVTVIAGGVSIADVTIQPTGAIAGTVSTASGTPVAGVLVSLGSINGTVSREVRADTGGAFSLFDVPEGVFTVSAADPTTGLRVSVPASVVRDLTTPVALTFPPVGRLEVQVNFPRGIVAGFAPVQLQEAVRGPDFRSLGNADAGGHKTMNGLGAGAFVVRAAHPNNPRITASVPGTLTADGSVAAVTITLPAAGTVRGLVTDQSGAVGGIAVTVRSSNPAFGGFQSTTTDPTGQYVVAGVPEGAFTATVQEFGRQLFGETSGRIDTDGQDVTANISLINNAVALPAYRYDANGMAFRIEASGRISDATNYAFGYYWQPGDGASQLDLVAGGTVVPFIGAAVGTMEQDGREIVIRQPGLAGLDVTRKAFVPRDGYFARYLELLTNPTDAPITVDLRLRSTVGNPSNRTSIVATSSGDAALDVSDPATADRWLTFDDPYDADPFVQYNVPATAFVFDGAGAPLRVASATVTDAASQEQALTYVWNAVTVPARQTVGVMHYVVQQVSQAGALAAAARLSQIPPEAIDGLSPEEVQAVRNFTLPSDGVSLLDPLPALTGTVSGRVLGSDGTTVVPDSQVEFRSLEPLFGRTISVMADSVGAFTFKGHIEDGSGSVPVPVAPFTLRARHQQTNVQVDQSGAFTGTYSGNLSLALGTATASSTYYIYYAPQYAIDADPYSYWLSTQSIAGGSEAPWFDVSFPADVAVSRVRMSTLNLLSARIDLIDAAGQIVASADAVDTGTTGGADVAVAGAGVRRVRITDLGDVGWIGISDLQIIGSAPSSGGATTQDVVFSNTGTVAATIHLYSGALVTSGTVELSSGAPLYTGATGYVTAGEARITGLPAASYSVRATAGVNGNSYFLTGTGSVAVTTGATATVDVRLEPTGTIRGTVRRGSGAPSIGSFVRLERSYPFLAVMTSTDTDGRYVFENVPFGYYTLYASEPNTGTRSYAYPALWSAGEVIIQDFTLVGLGTVHAHVQYTGGAPVPGLYVLVTPSSGGQYYAGPTDVNGDATIGNVVQGPFSVRAAHPLNSGLYVEAAGVLAGDGDVQSVTLTLPAVAAVTGTVTQPDGTPFPFPDVAVMATDLAWSPNTWDGNGHFAFNAVPVGQSLSVRAYWGSPYPYRMFYGETPFTLAADAVSETVDVRLPGFAKIALHLTRGDGVTPWAGAVIYSSDKFRPFFQSRGTTDANGNLTLRKSNSNVTPEQFAEGDVTIRVYDPNTGAALVDTVATVRFADVNGTVAVSTDAKVVAGNITGHVYGIDGATPLPGAYLQVLNATDFKLLRDGYTGADGSFALLNVLPGQQGFILRAYSPTFSVSLDQARTFSAAGETQQVNVVLPVTPATISGHVVAADGQTPIDNGYVELFDSEENYLQYTPLQSGGAYAFAQNYFTGSGYKLHAYDYSSGVSVLLAGTIPTAGAHLTVDIVLPLSVVRGRVRFSDGSGVPQPTVMVVDAAGVSHSATTSTAAGDYAVLNVAPGPVTVTAQDGPSGLNATATGTLAGLAVPLVIDVQLPLSGSVTGVVSDAAGHRVSEAWVALVSANLEFQRYAVTDADGLFRFDRVQAGAVYAQVGFFDGVDWRYVGKSGEVVADQTLALPLAWDGGGIVTGTVTTAGGAATSDVSAILEGFGGMGPNGRYQSVKNTTGGYSFTGVPAGNVQLVVLDNVTGAVAIADGVVTTGGVLTLNAQLGNGEMLGVNLDGADGFRYDATANGALGSGGTIDGRLRSAYSEADVLQVNGLSFPSLDAARPDSSGRDLTLGPVPLPDVVATRKVFVPATGGFARYLETLTNPTAESQTVSVVISGNTGNSEPSIVVAPSTTGNTFTVTEFVACDCSTPALARVFQGSGTPSALVSRVTMGHDGHFSFSYTVTLMPGATVTFMHFEVQRADPAEAQTQAQALVDLTDPHVLTGMSDGERMLVVNFVIPR